MRASVQECTLVILESGKRFPALLSDLQQLMPDRELCICRELTKAYEEIRRGPIVDMEPEILRGECVLVVGPGTAVVRPEEKIEGLKGIAKHLGKMWGISSRAAYNGLMTLKDQTGDKDD